MGPDIVRENIEAYASDQAREDWSADDGLYPVEQQIVADYFPPPAARILDLGCGAGRTTLGFEQLGYDVDAIDLSTNLVAEAKRRVSRSRVALMDARELQFPDASFDAAIFSFNGLDCVHPSAERMRVLREVHRVLKPGAVFYYSGHNGLGTWAPRPGDRAAKVLRRNVRMLQAQRRSFTERSRYLAYPDPSGTQVLYSAPPFTHVRDLQREGFEPLAVWAARGTSFREANAPTKIDLRGSAWSARMKLLGLSLVHPHVHYIARRA